MRSSSPSSSRADRGGRELPRSFFARKAPAVARDLIGKFLVRRRRGKTEAFMIVETEAYDGFADKASHAHRGKTARNEVMFREAGHIYVYFTYGMHWMLNLVAGRFGYPSAVLIRGVSGVSGPARLTKALGIDRNLNGKLLSGAAGLWVEDRGVRPPLSRILRTPRIGIRYAAEWAKKPWRFVLRESGRKGKRRLRERNRRSRGGAEAGLS